MQTSTPRAGRVRIANDRPFNVSGRYVLYWAQMFRRLHSNHALDHAIALAAEHKKPLVIYEGLKLNYPWANARHHTFILQGMRDTARAAKRAGVSYWPFVETPGDAGRGLVRKLASQAVCVVTDDYPAYITPAQNRALAAKADVPVILVDGNSLVPLSRLGAAVGAAAHIRPRIHKAFAEEWGRRAAREPVFPKGSVAPPFKVWDAEQDIAAFVAQLPLDQSVPAVPGVEGGSVAGQAALAAFVAHKLDRYADGRNNPDDPERNAASGLSAWLHYGHIGIQEVAEAVLGDEWTVAELNLKTRNKDDFFTRDANDNSFLDEAVTWRDLGHHWHWCRSAERGAGNAEPQNVSWDLSSSSVPSSALRAPHSQVPQFNFATMDFAPGGEHTLDVVLPEWARATLRKHAKDKREYTYDLDEFESASTHDELWNAAQKELIATGRIHNYLRMLWAKKVLEWSASPAEAYRTLEHLNNKYAIDGRDPNSYTGILWCFGLFDRPWAPERDVLGVLRYMSSSNTARKFDLDGYYEYVKGLPSPADVRAGRTDVKQKRLF
jgi:deoxyribodipyrimidine photo-lyase